MVFKIRAVGTFYVIPMFMKSCQRKKKPYTTASQWHLVKKLAYCTTGRRYTGTETCSRNLSKMCTDYT